MSHFMARNANLSVSHPQLHFELGLSAAHFVISGNSCGLDERLFPVNSDKEPWRFNDQLSVIAENQFANLISFNCDKIRIGISLSWSVARFLECQPVPVTFIFFLFETVKLIAG